MKQVILIMLVLAGLILAGCSAPSESPAPVETQTETETVVETTPTEPETTSEAETSTEAETSEPETTPSEPETTSETETPAPRVVEVELDAFSFGYSIEEIEVNEGDTVRIIMTNTGGSHDWDLDEFGVDGPVISGGQTTTMEFVADKKGSFEYYCSVGSHRAAGMVGTLIVN
jgi:nitrite reductase (NO-forming)